MALLKRIGTIYQNDNTLNPLRISFNHDFAFLLYCRHRAALFGSILCILELVFHRLLFNLNIAKTCTG
jgi:hypothetical protein